jgi:hypothetical protein
MGYPEILYTLVHSYFPQTQSYSCSIDSKHQELQNWTIKRLQKYAPGVIIYNTLSKVWINYPVENFARLFALDPEPFLQCR